MSPTGTTARRSPGALIAASAERRSAFEFKEGSDKMDLTVASFDDPSRFKPKHHFGAESMHRAWLNTEGLPEMRTEDYQKLVDKWVEATGKFPG